MSLRKIFNMFARYAKSVWIKKRLNESWNVQENTGDHSEVPQFLGLEFHAKLDIHTPLNILRNDGLKHFDLNNPAPMIDKEGIFGKWMPIYKTWRDFGYEIQEPDEFIKTSIGFVNRYSYLSFLLEIREILESNAQEQEKIIQLKDELSKLEWLDFVTMNGGVSEMSKLIHIK